MNKESVFNTVTMAKMHAKQGYLKKAAKIYQYLLEQDSGSKDINDALAEIERKKIENGHDMKTGTKSDNLASLFDEWFELIFKYKKYKKLKNLPD